MTPAALDSGQPISRRTLPRAKQPIASVLVEIDPKAPGGLQHQIYAGIRRAILDGLVAPGTRLPSSRSLATELGVSRTTTLLALEQLLAEGYLTARRGAGTFVARELPDDLPQPPLQAAARPQHRSLSRRGESLAAVPAPAMRLGGPPRAFRIGVPGLDLFPVAQWSRLARRHLRSLTPPKLDYGDPSGLRALRQVIAEHVQARRGTRCDADQVFVVAGAQRGLDLVCRLLLDPEDAVWLEDPGYPGARAAVLDAGGRIVPVPVDAEGLDVQAGARRADRARLVYVTPSHQFPLGVPMSLARRLALLRWARGAGAWVVEDDYDSEFRYGAHPIPSLHGLDTDGRVVYLGSFSKTLFPALRLGFLIVPGDLRDRFWAARRSGDQHPALFEQAVLADFMADGHFERHLRRMQAAYRERLEALAAAAGRLCRGVLSLRPVRTGMHAVADVIGADAELVWREAAARGIEVTPLAAYAEGPDASANALVLGFAAVPPPALRRGMERLAAAIEAAGG
jgi:GntR family transcriptional regulator/MocR family aminotransferase